MDKKIIVIGGGDPGKTAIPMEQFYGKYWGLVKDHVDKEGWFPDRILGQSTSLSVWVLSECEKKVANDEIYWRIIVLREKKKH